MDKKLWRSVEQLFNRALELPVEQRPSFVQRSAGKDSQLQFEVLTLLQSHEAEGEFLEQEAAADLSEELDRLTDEVHQSICPDQSDANPPIGKHGEPASPAEEPAVLQTQQAYSARPNLDDSKSSDSNLRDLPTQDLGDEEAPIRSPESRKAIESQLIDLVEFSRPDFVVKKVISRGGMGTVLRVYQRRLNRDVAVKILSTTHVDERLRRRFVRESQAAAQIRSDYVVDIHEVCNDPVVPFLVMELIQGPTLKRFIETESRIAPRQAAELARQIATGLEAAHQQHLIHRDIKPANILLEPVPLSDSDTTSPKSKLGAFRAKIIDFGLARDIDNPTGETQDLLFAGTLSYMSPEQVTSPTTVDHRSDVYSLGMTLYQMITGERPFHGAPHMVIRKIEIADPTPPRRLDDRIPKDLESICLKALSKDRNRRFQSAAEFAQDLTRFLENRPTLARPVTNWERLGRLVARNKKIAWLTGLAASLVLLLTISSIIFAWTVSNKNREIASHQTKTLESQVERILDADAGALLFAVNELASTSTPWQTEVLTEEFKKQFESPANDFNRKFNATVALSVLDTPRTDFIVGNLEQFFVSPTVCQNVITAIESDPSAIGKLKALPVASDVAEQAKRIIVLAFIGEFEPWLAAANNEPDPTLITEVIHQFGTWHGSLGPFLNRVEQEKQFELDWTICQALTLLDRRSLNQRSFEIASRWAQSRGSAASQLVVYNSAEQLLRRWNVDLPSAQAVDLSSGDPSDQGNASKNWDALANGIRMVHVSPGTAMLGRMEQTDLLFGYPPHEVTISRPFAIADTEVSVAQYREFLEDPDCPDEDKPAGFAEWERSLATSPTLNHPVQRVSWYDAVRFCNWLSKRENLDPVYQRLSDKVTVELENGDTTEYEQWSWDPTANGFRLPHEHEFEFACRDGSTTQYFFGLNPDYFLDYGLSSNNTRVPASPVRSRLPNRLGIFDMHGNVWEWCNDWFSYLDETSLKDPVGPSKPSRERFGRTTRSGGVATRSGESDSDARGHQHPNARYDNCGFRIARYLGR